MPGKFTNADGPLPLGLQALAELHAKDEANGVDPFAVERTAPPTHVTRVVERTRIPEPDWDRSESRGLGRRRGDLGQARPRRELGGRRVPPRRQKLRRAANVLGLPADKFKATQEPDIPLEAGYGGPRVGTVEHLELRQRLWVVGTIDDGWDLTRGPWQLSYELVEVDGRYILDAVSVVPKSATICMPLLEVRDGTLHHVARHVVYQDGATGEPIRHAAEQTQKARRGGMLLIRDPEREKWLEAENRRRKAEYRYAPPLSPEQQRRVPPQMRPGWKPGDLEWSQTGGRVLGVR